MPLNKANKIMKVYDYLESNDEYQWIRWADTRRQFSKETANKFFIGVMLDQGQVVERAWDSANYLVENYFTKSDDFWGKIATTHHSSIKIMCQKGYEGKSFAIKNTFDTFPVNLKLAAKKIIKEYESDVRNIWNVTPQDVSVIYDRLIEFPGIGDGLAKMAQFILVRTYGIAGGKKNQRQMAIKPDILVRRVLHRTGIAESEHINAAITAAEDLGLESPADFDAATWIIGREYCFKSNPNCTACPIQNICDHVNK